LGELEHFPVVGFKFLSSGRILRNVELGKVAAAYDADACESRRDARCADRRVRPTRGPADDAELLDPEGIGELNHVARPGTKRAPSEYVRPSNPGTVDGDQAYVRRGCDSFVGTPHP